MRRSLLILVLLATAALVVLMVAVRWPLQYGPASNTHRESPLASEQSAPPIVTPDMRRVVDSSSKETSSPTDADAPGSPGEGALHIRAYGPDGKPLEQVEVSIRFGCEEDYLRQWLTRHAGELGFTEYQPTTDDVLVAWKEREAPRTDTEGLLSHPAPAGVPIIVVGRSGLQDSGPVTVSVPSLSHDEEREVRLAFSVGPDRPLFGLVIEVENKLPIPGVLITLEEKDRPKSTHITDRLGQFSLTTRSWTEPVLDVRSERHGMTLIRVSGEHSDALQPLVIELSAAATVRGTVSGHSANPIANAEIKIAMENEDLSSDLPEWYAAKPTVWRTTTDTNGDYSISGLPAGVVLWAVTRVDGHKAIRGDIAPNLRPGEIRVLDYRFDAGALVQGRLLDQDGRPVPGAKVAIQRIPERNRERFRGSAFYSPTGYEVLEEVFTKKDGSFSIDGIPIGSYLVGIPTNGSNSLSNTSVRLDISRIGAKEQLTLRVHRGLFVKGMLLDHEGSPVESFLILGVDAAGRGTLVAPTDADGRFVIGPLLPGMLKLLPIHDIQDAIPKDASQIREVSAGSDEVILRLPEGHPLRSTQGSGD